MGIPNHLTCLLRNLHEGQDTTVRTRHETMDWFQIGKGVRQGCILSPCLFIFYEECIMKNAGLDESQARIKIAGRKIKNLRYANNTTLMAEIKRRLLLGRKVMTNLDSILKNRDMIQQSHCWAYTLRKPELKETHVPQCSSQHCL